MSDTINEQEEYSERCDGAYIFMDEMIDTMSQLAQLNAEGDMILLRTINEQAAEVMPLLSVYQGVVVLDRRQYEVSKGSLYAA